MAITPEKRKKATDMLLSRLKQIDGLINGGNYERYKKIFDNMSMAAFERFAKAVRDGEACLYVYRPNMKTVPNQKKIYDLFSKMGLELEQHVIMYDASGVAYTTPEKYMIFTLPFRRLEQFADHKLSVTKGDSRIDQMSGQVIGDDRAAAITNPENNGLAYRGLEKFMNEINNVRGGNVATYNSVFKRSLEETGHVDMDKEVIEGRNRVVVMTEVQMNSMGFESNIMGE